jgi:hypothetical protein
MSPYITYGHGFIDIRDRHRVPRIGRHNSTMRPRKGAPRHMMLRAPSWAHFSIRVDIPLFIFHNDAISIQTTRRLLLIGSTWCNRDWLEKRMCPQKTRSLYNTSTTRSSKSPDPGSKPWRRELTAWATARPLSCSIRDNLMTNFTGDNSFGLVDIGHRIARQECMYRQRRRPPQGPRHPVGRKSQPLPGYMPGAVYGLEADRFRPNHV